MISPDHNLAVNLWPTHLKYANTSCLESKQTALSLLSRPPPVEASPSDNNDTSELPYLCTEPVGAKSFEFTSVSTVNSLDIDNALLMAMLSGDETAAGAIEHSVHSRPTLYINPVSLVGNVVISAPSPVDSGYGSGPGTPLVGMCGGYGSDEWSPVDDTSSISDESSNIHMLSEGFSDAKYWDHVTDAKAFTPAPQGPVIPRIVLSDEEGRVVEATIDNQFEVFPRPESSPTDEDADSPYGGLMSLAAPENIEPASSVSCIPTASKIRNSATGAVLDRAFVSLIRSRATPSVATSAYYSRHHAPTFVLDCVGEEEEQRDEAKEEYVSVGAGTLFVLEKKHDSECVELEMHAGSVVEASRVAMPSECVDFSVLCLTEERKVVGDSLNYNVADAAWADLPPIDSSPILVPKASSEFNTWQFEDGEDDECEECGLFLTEPDNDYHQLFGKLDQMPSKPTIAFGLLKLAARATPISDLNTAYHVTAQRRAFRTDYAPCLYNCERGYWSNSGGTSSIICPRDCPAHGGRDACEVGAIFHRSALPPLSTTELDCAGPDYQAFTVEVVGLAPSGCIPTEEDLDDGDLILHRGEKFRSTENKNAPPKAGASYDEYMSHFMDDVDLPTSSSSENSKGAPFGKLVGGALKDMTVPEAVDHLKEGLEKTESAFRAALIAPFRFNSVADKLTQHLKSGDSKVHPSKERRASNAFRHHRRGSSASGIKTKWSNMFNKFTR
ncbi:unnamed protein product [Rhizoctonia solani]|uniref:Uncharacterized protein n=1 Tax=Rhizoctonia solani TaxID=456999 RepID=A0A8H2WS77_9AGAM|nr:unnamed protein product [Rhizoctonia solani]